MHLSKILHPSSLLGFTPAAFKAGNLAWSLFCPKLGSGEYQLYIWHTLNLKKKQLYKKLKMSEQF